MTFGQESRVSSYTRDKLVIQAVLARLFTEPGLRVFSTGPTSSLKHILLVVGSTNRVGLEEVQLRKDARRSLPVPEVEQLIRRNAKWTSTQPRFEKLTVLGGKPEIIVHNLSLDERSDEGFQKRFPDCRAWFDPALPGYSRDGQSAIVVGALGPSRHYASAIAYLKFKDGQWIVEWLSLTVHG
jgi:hypothetical protein